MNDDPGHHRDYADNPKAGGVAKLFLYAIVLLFIGSFIYGLFTS